MTNEIFLELAPIVNKYGWKIRESENNYMLINRIGDVVITIVVKGNKYTFLDNGCNKLMTGNGQLSASIEKLLTHTSTFGTCF